MKKEMVVATCVVRPCRGPGERRSSHIPSARATGRVPCAACWSKCLWCAVAFQLQAKKAWTQYMAVHPVRMNNF